MNKFTDNQAFCIAPWMHLQVEPNGDIQLCCASTFRHEHNNRLGNLNDSEPLDIWNNDQYRYVRRNIISGNKIPEYCGSCYKREEGGLSRTERQRFNEEFAECIPLVDTTHDDGRLDTLNIKYLEIRFNNLCNLKCRSCGPDWSTSWANEVGVDKPLVYNDSWRKLLPYASELQKIYFAGGEPLITPEHYDFLEELSNTNTDIELLYTSNFTRLSLKNRHVMDYWPKFKVVNACASIDHYDEYASYVRSGSNYNEILDNIKTIQNHKLPNVRTSVTTVYSLYNATRIGDLIIRLFEDGAINSINQWSLNMLTGPIFQIATHMPENAYHAAIENTQKGIDYLKRHGESPDKLIAVKSWLSENYKYNNELFSEFISYNKKLDIIRNTDINTLYPEFFQ